LTERFGHLGLDIQRTGPYVKLTEPFGQQNLKPNEASSRLRTG